MSTKHPEKFVPASSMRYMNSASPTHDGDVIKAKKIKSPDVMTMEFRVVNPRMKSVHYFRTLSAKNRFIERMAQQPNQEPKKMGGRKTKKE